ncbi:MAG: site-specific integrase [Gemmatimonadota bacterium]|nr:site-specific integrase [Gemmatimonadota bacterium]
MASATKRKKGWSYSTGEWGATRVRAFEYGSKGVYLEFYERDLGASGRPRRVRMALGHANREQAKRKADEVALKMRQYEQPKPVAPTLATLFDIYEREVTPRKSEGKRQHDRRCREMFLRYFGANRKPLTLSRVEWDRFIDERRRGVIRSPNADGARGVRDRVIAYDLKHLLAVFNWATVAGNGHGGVLLDRNPLKGMLLPKEESPERSVLLNEQYVALLKAARMVPPAARLLLVIAHETGHRIGAIRTLRWSDLDLEKREIHWRAENDKSGFGHRTPLTDIAVDALQHAQRQQQAIGDAWVFPSPSGTGLPCSRHLTRDWWERMAERAKLPKGQRFGWHSLRRQFASELKNVPLRDLAHLGGWKSAQTILACYMAPDEATQRAALAQRKTLNAGGLS